MIRLFQKNDERDLIIFQRNLEKEPVKITNPLIIKLLLQKVPNYPSFNNL